MRTEELPQRIRVRRQDWSEVVPSGSGKRLGRPRKQSSRRLEGIGSEVLGGFERVR